MAWCIMTNHVPFIFRSIRGEKPEQLLRDFKRFTSNKMVKSIKENVRKSRKAFLLERFKKAAKKSSNVKHYQFWSHNNRSIELWGNSVIREKMNYIHQNPVVERLVYNTEDYVYGSVKDDAGEEGILENIVVFEMVKML